MSFIAGRALAGKEGAYFFQESKHAVNRLAEKTTSKTNNNQLPTSAANTESKADILPEILMHSLPPNLFGKPLETSSFSTASKWTLPPPPEKLSSISPDVLNPLTAYLSLPQVTFGPKRWKLPNQENSVLASTANELRLDRYNQVVNPQKSKAAAEGLDQIGKSLAIATVIVFGGATAVFASLASHLDIQNSDDVKMKGKAAIGPKLQIFKEQLVPLRIWVEDKSKKWHLERDEDIKEKPIIKELSKALGVKPPS